MYIAATIALLICFTLPIFYNSINKTIKTIILILLFILSIIFIFIFFHEELSILFPYAFEGIKNMLLGTNSSVNTRLEQLEWAFTNNNLILIGNGIGKGEIMLESFYSLYYFRYGLIGVLLYLMMLLSTSYKSYKIGKLSYKKRYSESEFLFYFALSIFFIVAPFGLLSSCHQDTPKISLIFYGLIGMIYHKYESFIKSKV